MRLFLLSCILTATFACYGQVAGDSTHILPARNTFYIEAFGQGLLNSLSYDRLFRTDKKTTHSVSAGITWVPVIGIGDFYSGMQVSYNFLFSLKNHHLELGAGLNALMDRETIGVEYLGEKGIQKNYYTYLTPKLGYRFQRSHGGIFFRLTFTPLFALLNKSGQVKVGDEVVIHARSEFFTNVVSFGNRTFPWGGVSIGYTLKNRKAK
jgi:hypothetical protein